MQIPARKIGFRKCRSEKCKPGCENWTLEVDLDDAMFAVIIPESIVLAIPEQIRKENQGDSSGHLAH